MAEYYNRKAPQLIDDDTYLTLQKSSNKNSQFSTYNFGDGEDDIPLAYNGYITGCKSNGCNSGYKTISTRSKSFDTKTNKFSSCVVGLNRSICARKWDALYKDNPMQAIDCCLGNEVSRNKYCAKDLKEGSSRCTDVLQKFCKGHFLATPICLKQKDKYDMSVEINKFCVGDRLNKFPCTELCKGGICTENLKKYCVGRNINNKICDGVDIRETCKNMPQSTICKKYCLTHDCDDIYNKYCGGRGKNDSYCACMNSDFPMEMKPECFDGKCKTGDNYLTINMRKTLERGECPMCAQIINSSGDSYKLKDITQMMYCDKKTGNILKSDINKLPEDVKQEMKTEIDARNKQNELLNQLTDEYLTNKIKNIQDKYLPLKDDIVGETGTNSIDLFIISNYKLILLFIFIIVFAIFIINIAQKIKQPNKNISSNIQ
jgi:hypothetical protein